MATQKVGQHNGGVVDRDDVVGGVGVEVRSFVGHFPRGSGTHFAPTESSPVGAGAVNSQSLGC